MLGLYGQAHDPIPALSLPVAGRQPVRDPRRQHGFLSTHAGCHRGGQAVHPARDVSFHLTDEKKKHFHKKIYEFICTFDKNKIWIPADLSSNIETVAKEIESRSSRFFVASKQEEQIHRLPAERIEKINDELEKFYDYIHKEIDSIFDDLVEKITEKIST